MHTQHAVVFLFSTKLWEFSCEVEGGEVYRHVNTGELNVKYKIHHCSVVPAFSTIFDDMIGLGDDFSAFPSSRTTMVKSSANHSTHHVPRYSEFINRELFTERPRSDILYTKNHLSKNYHSINGISILFLCSEFMFMRFCAKQM